jgi:hypothetical protein
MKLFSSWLAATCLAFTLGCNDRPAGGKADITGSPETARVIANMHFAGGSVLAADQGGTAFKEIWDLPQTRKLRQETLDKLADSWSRRLQPKPGEARTTTAARLRPLLDDLLVAEWHLRVIEHPEQTIELVWALRLDEARTGVWRTNWGQLLSGAGADHITFLATNSWTVIHATGRQGGGASRKLPENDVIQKIKQGQRPVPPSKENWLSAEGDLSRLAEWSGWTGKQDWPRFNFSLTGKGEYLRSQARLTFRDPIGVKLERWRIPLETIRDPLLSFTAVQGFASWLQRQPFFKELGLQTAPNQLYLWGLSVTPFQLQAAVPVADAQSAINQVRKQLPQINKILKAHSVGEIHSRTNQPGLYWRGLPLLVPYLDPKREGNQEFLHAGIFPVEAPTTPAPPQLFEQLTGQKDLRYFEWEITQERLALIRPLIQLASMFVTVSSMSTNAAAHMWLDTVEPRLGNTVTEVRETSPHELSLVRTSHLGLNSIELFALANWLGGTNFPNAKFEIGFRRTLGQRQQP